MTDAPSPTFRVLGPLEVRSGERRLTVGSGRQRTLLAVLLMRAGDAVPVERLIDELWGAAPPPSAGHALEAYVSRLRGALSELDVTIERRGAGYRLDLGPAQVDSAVFEELLTQAQEASARGDVAEAGARARAALSLWRGGAYADVPFQGGAPSEATRLDELRLVAYEQEIDAALATGENAHAIGELRGLVDSDPYGEGFLSRLMVALYKSGRQAEALGAYETYRRRLSDDLGLEPGPALQQLSGQIVRHELELTSPTPAGSETRPRAARWRKASTRLILIGVLCVVGIGAGLAWVLARGSSVAPSPPRIALVLPRQWVGREDTYVTPFVDGLLAAQREYLLKTKTLVLDQTRPDAASLKRVREELSAGDFDLVLWAGLGPAEWKLAPFARRHTGTWFVYIDASIAGSPLESAPNITAMTFDDVQAGYLVGYLSALVAARGGRQREGRPRISVVGGMRIPVVTGLVEGFARGARAARPGILVDVEYSGSFVDESICDRIANRQIDRGSQVVFAAAGTCGSRALSVAGIRGVWGVGADADRSYLGSHILASTVKRYDRAVLLAIQGFLQHTLPPGDDVQLGLEDDAVGTEINVQVPAAVREKVARVASALRVGDYPTK